MNRRSLFAVFVGVGAAVAASRVSAAPTPEAPLVIKRTPLPIPRGTLVTSYSALGPCGHIVTTEDPTHSHGRIVADPTHTHQFTPVRVMIPECAVVTLISTGYELVLLDSPEGQAVLDSIAAPNAGQSRW